MRTAAQETAYQIAVPKTHRAIYVILVKGEHM